MTSPEARELGSKAGLPNKCAGCPYAGACTPCKPQSLRSESLIPTTSNLVASIKDLITPQGVRKGSFVLRPLSEAGRPTTLEASKETCFVCGKRSVACTCSHSGENLKAA